MRDGKAFLMYPERCDYEARCEEVCPVGAIELPYRIVLGTPGEDSQGEKTSALG
jgi:formate hydrogenlyase subunit 6/NADH:ubiquinone oxidoreductase subunit I